MGVPPADAIICADVLITSDLRGIESHGIGRLKYYYDRIISGQHQVKTQPEITKESPTTAVVDGNHGMGMVISVFAMDLAIRKAREYGLGAVAVRNSTHFGIAGYYALRAIHAGMIGIVVTNARPSIAPTFGVQPMLGTNPICFGAPTDEDFPFLFDAATSIIQRGKVEVHCRKEKNLPEGLVIDQAGGSISNPSQILQGLSDGTVALLPLGGAGEEFGGHKGYGLATMVEILSASLQAGKFLLDLNGIDSDGKKQTFNTGHFFLAMDIEHFTELAQFKKTTGEIMRQLRNARKAPGNERIYTPGEKEYENERLITAQGIEINQNLQKEIKFIQSKLQMFDHPLPF